MSEFPDDISARLTKEHRYAVCTADPFRGEEIPPTLEARLKAAAQLRDDDMLHDVSLAADATSVHF